MGLFRAIHHSGLGSPVVSDTERTSRMRVVAWLTICTLGPLVSSPAVGQTNTTSGDAASRLTIERLYSLPNLIGTAPGGFAWSSDGRYVAFLWNDSGHVFRDVWMLDVENPETGPERVTRMPRVGAPPIDPNDPVSAAEAEARLESELGVSSVVWHPDGRRMLVSLRGDLWLVSPGSDL
jgi:hypothetical protein